jgi:propionyl-CoA carboxylase alpha chain
MLPKKKADLSSIIIAPMPGMVKSVSVEVGQMVGEGQEICVVEAMKMQNKLLASRPGKVFYLL